MLEWHGHFSCSTSNKSFWTWWRGHFHFYRSNVVKNSMENRKRFDTKSVDIYKVSIQGFAYAGGLKLKRCWNGGYVSLFGFRKNKAFGFERYTFPALHFPSFQIWKKKNPIFAKGNSKMFIRCRRSLTRVSESIIHMRIARFSYLSNEHGSQRVMTFPHFQWHQRERHYSAPNAIRYDRTDSRLLRTNNRRKRDSFNLIVFIQAFSIIIKTSNKCAPFTC